MYVLICLMYVSRYEGTGRSLSLKLISQLRQQSSTMGILTAAEEKNAGLNSEAGPSASGT